MGRAHAVITISALHVPASDQVRAVLVNNCVICHSSLSESFGRLDMSQWVADERGVPGFVQVDASGRRIANGKVFRGIWDRITSANKDQRMPLGYVLKTEEFEPLRAWLEAQVKHCDQLAQ